jgi:outer membrane biosynthesis protein TonB
MLWLAAIAVAAAGFVVTASSAQAAPSSHRVYSLKEVERAPVPTQEIHIRFPRALRREHAEITLRFVVTTEGKVANLTVVKFSDPDMIDAAYGAYDSAEFSPALKGGKPVDATMEVTEIAK